MENNKTFQSGEKKKQPTTFLTKAFLPSFMVCHPKNAHRKGESHQTRKNGYFNHMGGPRGHYAKWDKSDKDTHTVQYLLYMESKKPNLVLLPSKIDHILPVELYLSK